MKRLRYESLKEKTAVPELGRSIFDVDTASEFIRTLETRALDYNCAADMMDAPLMAIKHSALLSSVRQISL